MRRRGSGRKTKVRKIHALVGPFQLFKAIKIVTGLLHFLQFPRKNII